MARLYQTGEEKKLQMHMEFALLSFTSQYFQHNSSILTGMHSLDSPHACSLITVCLRYTQNAHYTNSTCYRSLQSP